MDQNDIKNSTVKSTPSSTSREDNSKLFTINIVSDKQVETRKYTFADTSVSKTKDELRLKPRRAQLISADLIDI